MRGLGWNVAGNLIAWGLIAVLTWIAHHYSSIDWLWLAVFALGLAAIATGVLAKLRERRSRRDAGEAESPATEQPEPAAAPAPPAPTLREELVAMTDEGLGIKGLLAKLHGTAYAASRMTFEFGPTYPRVRDYLRLAQALIHRADAREGDSSLLDGIEDFDRAEEAVDKTIDVLAELAARESAGPLDTVARVMGEADAILDGMNMQLSGGKVASEDWYIDATVQWELRMEQALRSAGADELDLAEFRRDTVASLRAFAQGGNGHLHRVMAHFEERRDRAREIARELRSRG